VHTSCPPFFLSSPPAHSSHACKCVYTHRSLLHHAAWAGNLEVFRAIVEAGGDVERRRNTAWRPNGGVRGRGNTPLHAAVMYRRVPIIKFLLQELGCDVNSAGEQGYTPLHISTKFNYPEIVELLLRSGARTDMITRDEKTARDLAVWGRDRSHEQMGDMLALFDKFDAECRARAAAAGQSTLPGAPLMRLEQHPARAPQRDRDAAAMTPAPIAAAHCGDALDHWLQARAAPAPCASPALPQALGPPRHQDQPPPARPHELAHAQNCQRAGGFFRGAAAASERTGTGSRASSALRTNNANTMDMLGGRWQKTIDTRPW